MKIDGVTLATSTWGTIPNTTDHQAATGPPAFPEPR